MMFSQFITCHARFTESGGVAMLNKTALVDSELWILFDQILLAGEKNLT